VCRAHSWLCWSCRWWRTHYPLGDCDYCGRTTRIGEQRACRLCLDQARMLQGHGRALNLAAANRNGQQLYFANMRFHERRTPRLDPEPRPARRAPSPFRPLPWQQLPLFHIDPEPAMTRERALVADSDLIRCCKDIVRDHASAHGWTKKHTYDVIRVPAAGAGPSTHPRRQNQRHRGVEQLPRYGGNVTITATLDVLAAAGLLNDDRPTHVQRYFAGKTANLPQPMKAQLEVWLEVMLNGSHQAPRRRSRDPQTARLHILGITPILQAWSDAGHRTLADITPDQVLAALPKSGTRRNFAEQGLRSLFRVLKPRKLIFQNPTRGMPATPVNATVPLPLDTDAIRRALNSADPATALAVAWSPSTP
jgi:hypothetical protein